MAFLGVEICEAPLARAKAMSPRTIEVFHDLMIWCLIRLRVVVSGRTYNAYDWSSTGLSFSLNSTSSPSVGWALGVRDTDRIWLITDYFVDRVNS